MKDAYIITGNNATGFGIKECKSDFERYLCYNIFDMDVNFLWPEERVFLSRQDAEIKLIELSAMEEGKNE